MWTIEVIPHAHREIDNLPGSITSRILRAIAALAADPFPANIKKLKGKEDAVYRARVGDYRIQYTVDSASKPFSSSK
jgi:mRNA interferase RelE/StbE